ncbi:MAG: outer membrane protein assembly factor BamD [Desulfuromonas sp.]|nr:outer membrane protein assembly factor BamD [Desulfuromonas sp.]
MANTIKTCLLFTMIALALSACSSTPPAPVEKNALYYFQSGEQEFEAGHHKKAIEQWQKVRDSFASPELTALAELKIADTQYAQEQYVEAIASYEDFLKQHPSNIRKSDVLLRLGKSHFQLILAADRDQTATRNALNTFEQLKKNFPGKIEAQELDSLIMQCKTRLAENAAYIGNFYLKTKQYKAAIARLEQVRTTYPEFKEMGQVIYSLAQARQLNGETDKAIVLFNQIDQFNDADLIKKAQKTRQNFNI